MAEILFYLLSALALCGAAGVVLARSPMMSVLSLLTTFLALAVVYLLLGFEFLAAVQILVYAGAILVLFLFVIMLLDLHRLAPGLEFQRGLFASRRSKLAAAVAAVLGLAVLVASRAATSPADSAEVAAADQPALDRLQPLALELFGRHSLAFEATSLLLLATMVAVMLLAKRSRTRATARAPQASGPDPRRSDAGPAQERGLRAERSHAAETGETVR